MIKNKVVNIKIIFKIYLKILKNILGFKQTFVLQNIKEQFSKTIFKNYFSKLFLKIVTKQNLYFRTKMKI